VGGGGEGCVGEGTVTCPWESKGSKLLRVSWDGKIIPPNQTAPRGVCKGRGGEAKLKRVQVLPRMKKRNLYSDTSADNKRSRKSQLCLPSKNFSRLGGKKVIQKKKKNEKKEGHFKKRGGGETRAKCTV